jgi:hypothetical protein
MSNPFVNHFTRNRWALAPAAEAGAGSIDVDDGDTLAGLMFSDMEPEAAPEPEVEEAEIVPDEVEAEVEDDAEVEEPEEGDEDEEAVELKGQKADPENMWTVKVDGTEFDVSETELVAGYQRQKDYTQKTQALSNQMQEFNQGKEAQLTQLRDALAYYALPTTVEPKPEQYAGRPDAFMQAYGRWQKESTRQSEATNLLEQITTGQHQETLQRELVMLNEKLPEWSDPAAKEADISAMSKVGLERYGFTQDEIDQVADHRLLLLLRDASRVAQYEAKPVVMKRKTEIKPKLSAGTQVKSDPKAEANAKALKKLNTRGKADPDDLASLFYTS